MPKAKRQVVVNLNKTKKKTSDHKAGILVKVQKYVYILI